MNKSKNLFARFTIILIVLFNLSACVWEHSDEPRGFTLPNQGLSGPVNSVVLAPDGSGDVYLGGNFSTYNNISSEGIIRLHSDSTVDKSFVVGSGFDGAVNVIVPAADGTGDIYVGGEFSNYNGTASNSIIRLHRDGTVNGYFVPGSGIQLFDMPDSIATTDSTSSTESNYLRAGKVYSIVPAADGSGDIYVGGWFDSYNGTARKSIVRLHSDGTVDSSFIVGSGFSIYVHTIALATNGSGDIYVGGSLYSYNGTGINGIIRLHRDGRVDSHFAVGSGFRYGVSTIVPVTDGSGDIYVGGSFKSYNGIPINRIIRLHSDGAVDSRFAVGSGFDGSVRTIVPAVDGSGDIFVGGSFTGYNGNASQGIIRLHRDGSVNNNFAASLNAVSNITPITDGTGDLYVMGAYLDYKGVISPYLIRLTGNGSISKAYAENAGFFGSVKVISRAVDGTGDVYVSGNFTRYNGKPTKHVIRLNKNGTLDNAFDVDSDFDTTAYAIVPATDGTGDIYVGGQFTRSTSLVSFTGNRVIRLNEDGTKDRDFVMDSGYACSASLIVPATDGTGDIYVGNCLNINNGTASYRIIRLHSDGSVDSRFFIGSGFDASVTSIAPVPGNSGDIYVGGNFSSYNGTASQGIIRLHRYGTVDSRFKVGTGFERPLQSGEFKLNLISETGELVEAPYSGPDVVRSIVPTVDGSGDVYVGGLFSRYNGIASKNIIRLNRDGTVDNRFVSGSGFDRAVSTILNAADGSGDIYATGRFSHYNSTVGNSIIRLKNDGTVDDHFDMGSGFRRSVSTIVAATDGSGGIYVGGYFYSYNTTTAWGIVALNPDGSIY